MTSSTTIKSRRVILDPAFAIEWRDVDDFLNEFGPYNGRYIPSYPNDWTTRLRGHLAELDFPPRKRLELQTKIANQARLCTFPENWAWDDSRQWKENLGELSLDLTDSIVIGTALDPEPYHAWQDVIDEIRATRSRSWVYKGSVSEYKELCRPLLLASPAVYLVDPYLDPFDQDAEFLLRGLFEQLKGSRCYSLEVIRRWPIKEASTTARIDDQYLLTLERELAETYQALVPKDRTFRLHCVVEPRGTEAREGTNLRLHDRFFLTKYGAINFGHGFRLVGKGLPQQNAFVVDAGHHVILKRTYIEGVAHHGTQQQKWPGIPAPVDVITFTVSA